MKNIFSILGSSAFGVFVTVIFNWMQNRQTSSFHYLTDERKKWRETVRDISAKIEKCEYKGSGKHRIEQYLTQLQMNINPYGSVLRPYNSYEKDNYIWNAIDGIRNATDKEAFDKNKKLLLMHLSVMLKLDWERSKKELKNFSFMKFLWVLTAVLWIAIYLYEYFILNIGTSGNDIMFWVFDIMVILILYSIILCNYLAIDSGHETILSLKKHMGHALKSFISDACWVFAFIAAAAHFLCFCFFAPDLMLQHMRYYTASDGQVYVTSNFEENFFTDFQTKLQQKIGKKVIILEAEDLDLETEGIQVDYDYEIKEILSEKIIFWGALIFIRDFLITAIFSAIIRTPENIDYDARFCITSSQNLILNNSRENVCDILEILDGAIDRFKVGMSDNETDELLGLVYLSLCKVSANLGDQLRIEETQIENIQQWEVRNQKQKCIKSINDSIALLKQFSIRRNRRVKLDLLKKLSEKLQQISRALSKIPSAPPMEMQENKD